MNIFSTKNYPIMNIRTKHITVFLVAACMLIVYGCDNFLSVPAKGSLSEEVVANSRGVETLLIGAYGALDGQGGGNGWAATLAGTNAWEAAPDNWVYGSITGGDAHKGSEPGDQNAINSIANFNATASNGFFDSKWRVLYEGVNRTNAVLSILPQVEDMTEAEKTQAAAEARFLRGHFYFELKKMFNMVPWVDETTEDPNQPNDQDIWPNIEADFQYAYNNLAETKSDAARANKWAAGAYLAKTYVFQQKWQPAKDLYDVIIPQGVTAQGVPYDLFDDFQDNFNPAAEDGSPESVFSIEMVANDGTGWISNANQGDMLNYPYNSPFRCCGFYQPTQALVNSFKTANGVPEVDTYNNSPMVKNDQGITSTESYEPYTGTLDPRVDFTTGRRGVPYHDWGPHPGQSWIRNQSYAGPYAPLKHIYWQAQAAQYSDQNGWAPGSAINYSVIRFADVLLMAAEAEVEVGSPDQARQYVNRVRARAANQSNWVNNDFNRPYANAIVNSEAEMLATDTEPGEWVIREDRNSTFVLLTGSPGDINNWQEYQEPNYDISQYTTTWTDQAQARQYVHFERKLELAMEGHRFFDLVRWGEAEQKLNAFFGYEGNLFNDIQGGQFSTGRNEYYPIPQNQIDLSVVNGEPRLKQNPGYN